jgi:predicted Zn finger-like uncharacterized protein
MTEQPKTVVCTSCSAKFHVPDELIRGKLVKFRCRKCGSAIDVDGRKSARPAAAPVPPPTPEVTAVDTPATFSQRTLPPPRPPVALSSSSPNLHPWPEPPRTRSSTAPTAIFDSNAPEESLPQPETVRDPSNRAPKIAAVIALLIAAGLSGFGLAMRGSPGAPGSAVAGETPPPEAPSDSEAAVARSRPAAEAKLSHSEGTRRNPTRVTDLPPAIDGVPPTLGAGTAAPGPAEAASETQEPPREALNTPPTPAPPSTAALPNAADVPPPSPAGPTGPTSNGANGPSLPSAAPTPVVGSPAPASRAKGDFNTQAAREALEDAAGRAGKCRNIDTPAGTARVAVTFAPNGHVTNAVIESGPFVGTTAGSCVASKFRAAKVPPFSGDAVLVRKTVPF